MSGLKSVLFRMKSLELVIEPGYTDRRYWKDLWDGRELIYNLAWRDILARYKQTIMGVGWILITFFVTFLAFTLVFGSFAKLPSNGTPYPVMVYVGLLPWQFFSYALSACSRSLVNSSALISKVYFPKMILPISALALPIVDSLVSVVMLVALLFWYHIPLHWQLVALPLFLSLLFIVIMGFGLWTAALNVKYRDFQFIVALFLQVGMFISPVGYSSAIVPSEWRFIFSLNPLTGVIEGFRWAILGSPMQISWLGFTCSVFISCIIFLTGFWYFRKTERLFADLI